MRLNESDAMHIRMCSKHGWAFCDGKCNGCETVLIDQTKYAVKHGWWMKYPGRVVSDDGMWGETLYDCSNCGHTVHVVTEFCSKCGTKMAVQGEIQVRWKR